jgi:hypothetical protein
MALAVALAACPAPAVIIIGSSAGNTSAPADSGLATRWNQVGNFNSYLGTPIASQFFLTAKHLGNLTGQSIVFSDSTSYTTTAVFNDPNSDLAIYQIAGTFPNDKIVPMYAGSLFLNQPLTIFGRGVPRTNTVVTGSASAGGTEAKGWTWGTGTGARSWGTNTLDGLANLGSPGVQLQYEFDAGGGGNEGVLSLGDSGGPVFMQEQPGGDWKLAGINYGVAAIFNTVGSGTGFYAAVYDTGGLYSSNTLEGPWTYEADTLLPVPAASYSTTVSLRSSWISSVISVPEPWTLGMLCSACLPLLPLLRRRRGRVTPSGGR